MGKRTAQKDITIDTTSDSQVNSNFPNRWSPASLTFNNYFYLFYILCITWITTNNNAPHLKSPKNQSRRAALGRPAIKITGGLQLVFGWPSLFKRRSHGPRWPFLRYLRFEPEKYVDIYLKIFFFRTTCLRCLKFVMKHDLVVLYRVCSNEDPRVQDSPVPGVWGSHHRNTLNIIKNLLLQNHWALMLPVWYVAFASGPSTSLFKWMSQGQRWRRARGSQVVALPSGPRTSLLRW